MKAINYLFITLILCISSEVFSQNLTLIPFRNSNNKWGYCNKQKQLIVPCEFESACPIIDGLGKFVKNGKTGYIDATGKIVTEPIYDEGRYPNNGLALVKKNGKYGYINSKGVLSIPLKYDKAESFYKGYAEVYINDSCGIIDPTGKVIVPLKYKGVSSYPTFTKGFILMCQSYHPDYAVVFVNKKGEEMFGQSFRSANQFEKNHTTVKSRENEKYGVINNKGKVVVPFEYDVCYPFNYGLSVCSKNNLFGVIDTLGKMIIPLQYKEVRVVDKNLFFVKENDSYFLVNRKLERLNDKNYNSLSYTEAGMTQVSKNGLWNFVNQKGEEITTFEYAFSNYFVDGYGVLANEDKFKTENYKIIDTKGQTVLSPAIYSFFDDENIQNGIVCYSKYDPAVGRATYGIINLKGKGVNHKYYFIPKHYTVKENKSLYLVGGLIQVHTNDKDEIGYIDLEGNEYWEPNENDRIYNEKVAEISRKYYNSQNQSASSSSSSSSSSNLTISFTKNYFEMRTITSPTDVKPFSKIGEGPIGVAVGGNAIEVVGLYSKLRIDDFTIQSSQNTVFEGAPALNYNTINTTTKRSVQFYFINEQNTVFVIDGSDVVQFKGY